MEAKVERVSRIFNGEEFKWMLEGTCKKLRMAVSEATLPFKLSNTLETSPKRRTTFSSALQK
jgi:hypothetical protein